MSIQITILGLGKTGASIGLALGQHSAQMERTGFDPRHATARQAGKINAVDRVELNILKSVKQADIILLALPINRVKETLKNIAPGVRPGVVILDTSPSKQSVADWASELLPADHHYVGMTPLLNPLYLEDQGESIQSARVDLFKDSVVAIAAPVLTDAAAIKLAADLAGLLGARPFFCDLIEMDGMTTSTRLLPQLLSTALLNASVGQPGWQDAGKFSGAEYAAVCSGIAGLEESSSLSEAALLNKVHLLRSLDALISALYDLRDDIENDQVRKLETKVKSARDGRMKWWFERQKLGAQDKELQAAEMPKAGDFWKQQMGFLSRLSSPRPSKTEEKD
jgi:prephenate dehydrogenase